MEYRTAKMADLFTLGTGAVRDENGNQIPPTVRLLLQGGEDESDVEDYGDIPLSNALGVTALPAAADDDGSAEGIAVEVSSYGYACVGARDTRCSDVVGQLKAGETAVHNTGGDKTKRSRAFFKEDCASIIVGNDVVLMLDRKNKKITITGFGHIFEMSEANGVTLAPKGGKAGIQMTEAGSVYLWGANVNLGGRTTPGTPANAVIMGPSGITGVPAPNVYITL